MTPDQIEPVVHTWIGQFRELGGLPKHQSRSDLRESRRDDGSQQPAPSLPDLGNLVHSGSSGERTDSPRRAYLKSHGTCLLCDYAALEQSQQVRMVCENEGFVALVPFWAVWPFELLVCSRRHIGSMNDFSDGDSRLLSGISASCDFDLRQGIRGSLPLFDGIPSGADGRGQTIRNGISMRIFIRRCCGLQR